MYTVKSTVEDEAKKGHGFQVVKRLLRGYQRKGHTLYVDNYFTSINLAKDLFSKGTQLVGTIRSNRNGIPDFLKLEKLKKSEMIFARRKRLFLQRWRDKKRFT